MGTGSDKKRNEYVRGTAKIEKLGDKLRNAMLRWYGHVKRREVPGRRKRGRPRRRWMDLAREDMERVEAKDTKSTGTSGKYFRAVETPNKEKPNRTSV